MRCTAVLVGLILTVGGLVGCKQQMFIDQQDYDTYKGLGLTVPLDTSADSAAARFDRGAMAPATVLDPDRPIRYLSLQEAIAIALEQGNIGNTSALFSPGFNIDNGVSFSGNGVFGDDNIRVLSLDPSIQATDIEASLSK